MRIDIVSIFPGFFAGPLDYGIVRRAREQRLVEIEVHDLRAFTHDRHRTIDDRPFGGGQGMVLKPEPLFEAVEALTGGAGEQERPAGSTAVVLLSASGKLFRQATAQRWAELARIVLLCGRYEGVDERVADHLATEEISVGDFVLSGGELPAALAVDAVTRLIPGALGNEASAVEESFAAAGNAEAAGAGVAAAGGSGILDCPHYTRPQVFRGWGVPEVLVSGNHEEIRQWRRRMALEKTLRNRPELLAGAALDEEARRLLEEIRKEG
jgi:tRNA (guanine37-N1)-methyltransferase